MMKHPRSFGTRNVHLFWIAQCAVVQAYALAVAFVIWVSVVGRAERILSSRALWQAFNSIQKFFFVTGLGSSTYLHAWYYYLGYSYRDALMCHVIGFVHCFVGHDVKDAKETPSHHWLCLWAYSLFLHISTVFTINQSSERVQVSHNPSECSSGSPCLVWTLSFHPLKLSSMHNLNLSVICPQCAVCPISLYLYSFFLFLYDHGADLILFQIVELSSLDVSVVCCLKFFLHCRPPLVTSVQSSGFCIWSLRMLISIYGLPLELVRFSSLWLILLRALPPCVLRVVTWPFKAFHCTTVLFWDWYRPLYIFSAF